MFFAVVLNQNLPFTSVGQDLVKKTSTIKTKHIVLTPLINNSSQFRQMRRNLLNTVLAGGWRRP